MRFLLWVASALAIATSGAAYGASILDFDKWMQRIEKRALSVQRNMKRADREASAADAKEIEELYRLMQEYFENAGGPAEAVQLSRRGRSAAATLATHTAAGNFEQARETMRSIMRDCHACHHEYKPLT